MIKASSAILIFDVGKTNKKLLVFDSQYKLLHAESVQFDETIDEDGFSCDNVDLLTEWIRSSFQRLARDHRFTVQAVNFSGYGASLIFVGKQLKPTLHLSNYLKPYPADLQKAFYDRYGGTALFSMRAASPVLGSLNSGMQLFRLKREKPQVFEKIAFALHLPQYLSSILTRTAVSEITSIGCHTNLWDFQLSTYHEWVAKEGVDLKLAPVVPANECFAARVHDSQVQVGPGLHDSSAALIPYLLCFHEPFVLLSTGTWCISLNPFNHTPLSSDELTQDCLCYLTHKGFPIKASRLFAGFEHDKQLRRLADHFNLAPGYFASMEYDLGIGEKLIRQLAPEIPFENLPSFDTRETGGFSSPEEAYHVLVLDIVARQRKSTSLVLGPGEVRQMFVDGGFSKNNIYMNLLVHAFPGLEVFSAQVPEASALGAALAIHGSWNDKSIPLDLIELRSYSRMTERKTG